MHRYNYISKNNITNISNVLLNILNILFFLELKEFFEQHEKVSEEDFNKKRKDLKRLIHHRQMNKKQKNRPFRNKLGGARKGIGKKSSFMSKPWNQRRSKPKSRMYK